ncbi:hypothetical protein GGH91_002790 [Coemansia sp. RSA 2671]|uniref:Uncharacterized protein n=2 Tax=Coemansia TaxID=4863 RepID=A0A9W8GFH0_9FUNG|nr:hypothetical protein LPJ60_004730 [Coemansia sp. RSA 2675]KAJ2344662.1 hypothetical protein GGH91_002790 [Coemansia sp. RSA 2671]KAJ2683941.1 hypothetical protein IWW39_005210 [Coemansia spiralis]
MDYVQQQFTSIVKDMHRVSQAAGHVDAEISDLYVLLGHEHMLAALRLVDCGVVCLSSSHRSLFKVKCAGQPCDDVCYCLLPGPYCSVCTRQEPAGAAAPCVHITAVLVAIAQSRFASETLPARELAAALFSIT